MEVPEKKVYRDEEIDGIVSYLSEKDGEKVKTSQIRLASTVSNGLDTTEEVYRVLEELEKACFVEKIPEVVDDTWEVSGFYDSNDARNYLTETDFTGRKPHVVGPGYECKQLDKTMTVEEMFE